VEYFDWAENHAKTRPNKLAIHDLYSGAALSYANLETRSNALGGYLQHAGLTKGGRVAILARNCPHFFELQFACAKIGAVVVPLNWRLTVPELQYIVRNCEPDVLIYDDHFTDQAQQLKELCEINELVRISFETQDDFDTLIRAALPCRPARLTHDDLIMIMYTSGTTGNPKGAMITHGMNFINCVNAGIPARITPDTVQLVVLPLFHSGGLNCWANPVLHAGGTVELMREFDASETLRALSDNTLGITHFFAVPAPYQFMMQHPKFPETNLGNLKVAGIGGAPCPKSVLQTWSDRNVSMIQSWGMTETSPGAIALDVDEALRKIGSAGKPLMHTQVKIVDKDNVEVQAGEAGELLIRGPNITPGYWQDPEKTNESFVDDWLKTGDAAMTDDEGFVYIVDRWKDMYISGGENVYPAEVENILTQLPQVSEAAVIGVPDERWGETGKAILVLKTDQSLESDAVISHCLQNLAKFKVPKSVEFIDALPRGATGKILKRTLRELYTTDSQEN